MSLLSLGGIKKPSEKCYLVDSQLLCTVVLVILIMLVYLSTRSEFFPLLELTCGFNDVLN